MITKTSFYFVRHGQTDWNTLKRVQGSADIPLNQTGLQQAESVAQAIKHLQFGTICSSPLQRAMQTAKAIAVYQPQANFHIVPELRERSWGVGEGVAKDDAFDRLYYQIVDEGLPQEAESITNFLHRVHYGINQALTMPGPVLIVAHGYIFRVLGILLNISPESIPNCTVIHFFCNNDTWHYSIVAKPNEKLTSRIYI